MKSKFYWQLCVRQAHTEWVRSKYIFSQLTYLRIHTLTSDTHSKLFGNHWRQMSRRAYNIYIPVGSSYRPSWIPLRNLFLLPSVSSWTTKTSRWKFKIFSIISTSSRHSITKWFIAQATTQVIIHVAIGKVTKVFRTITFTL